MFAVNKNKKNTQWNNFKTNAALFWMPYSDLTPSQKQFGIHAYVGYKLFHILNTQEPAVRR